MARRSSRPGLALSWVYPVSDDGLSTFRNVESPVLRHVGDRRPRRLPVPDRVCRHLSGLRTRRRRPRQRGWHRAPIGAATDGKWPRVARPPRDRVRSGRCRSIVPTHGHFTLPSVRYVPPVRTVDVRQCEASTNGRMTMGKMAVRPWIRGPTRSHGKADGHEQARPMTMCRGSSGNVRRGCQGGRHRPRWAGGGVCFGSSPISAQWTRGGVMSIRSLSVVGVAVATLILGELCS